MRARMMTYQICEALSNYAPVVPDTDDPFHVKIADTEDVNKVYYEFTAETVLTVLLNRFGEWSFVYNAIDSRYGYTDPSIAIIRQWTDYKMDNLENWQRIAKAYNAEYNPIHNYDKTISETINNDSGYTNTDTYDNYKITNNPASSTQTHDFGDGLTTTTQSTTYNDENLVDKLKNVTNGAETTTTTFTTANETTHTGSHTLANNANNDTTRNYKEFGNIGVMTTQQMINAETEMRKFNMLDKIIYDFAKEYLVLLMGDDDDEC